MAFGPLSPTDTAILMVSTGHAETSCSSSAAPTRKRIANAFMSLPFSFRSARPWSHRRALHVACCRHDRVLRFDADIGFPAVSGSLDVVANVLAACFGKSRDVDW